MNTNRDYEVEYLTARVDYRSAETVAERDAAAVAANKVARAASRAGVKLDEIALDEQARQCVHGAR